MVPEIARWPIRRDIDLVRVGDGSEVYEAIGPRAFEGAEVISAVRHKPGVARVVAIFGNVMLLVFAKDALVPAPIAEDG